jgi:transcription factor C subunit 6
MARIDLYDRTSISMFSLGCIAVYHIGTALKSVPNAGKNTRSNPFIMSLTVYPDTPTITDLLPSYYLTIHQSAIRALAWIRAPPCNPSGTPRTDQDPTVIASAGYDGMECLTDVRQGHGSVMNRTRGMSGYAHDCGLS